MIRCEYVIGSLIIYVGLRPKVVWLRKASGMNIKFEKYNLISKFVDYVYLSNFSNLTNKITSSFGRPRGEELGQEKGNC